MEFADADDVARFMFGRKIQDQPNGLADDALGFSEQFRGIVGIGKAQTFCCGHEPAFAQALAQLGAQLVEHGDAEFIEVFEVAVEGIRVQASLPCDFAQT